MKGVEGKIKGGDSTLGLSPICTSVFGVAKATYGGVTNLTFSRASLGETVTPPGLDPVPTFSSLISP